MIRIYVHGGAAGVAKEPVPDLTYAAAAGRDEPTALDAVERAVIALEDDPALNAGYGAVLSRAGTLELDAGIADGTGGFGSVIGVQVRHPISLARRVMEATPHVMIAGAGAMELGKDLEVLEATTPEQVARWERARDEGSLDSAFGRAEFVDTVGAVAIDGRGGLAAASSTGGVFAKMPGRVGDAPIFGGGVYASPGAAVVGTGVGEPFITTLACARVGMLIEDGTEPQEAVERILDLMGASRDLPAGILALDAEGRFGSALRGASMPLAGVDAPIEAPKRS